MPDCPTIEDLWGSVTNAQSVFRPYQFSKLPNPARDYLVHAIAPGTLLASAVHLRMHGEIKLDRWRKFRADQVIRIDRGMVWQAALPGRGPAMRCDEWVMEGRAYKQWRGHDATPDSLWDREDLTLSAIGRFALESIWLPPALARSEIMWSELGDFRTQATLPVHDTKVPLTLSLSRSGAVTSASVKRWGKPKGDKFQYTPMGFIVSEEATFGGYTIPVKLRAGWYFGTKKFETDGEYLRLAVDEAEFR